MSIFGQLKGAQEMLKGMSPEQISDLLEKAKESKSLMEDAIKEQVERIIKERQLVSREEVAKMISESK